MNEDTQVKVLGMGVVVLIVGLVLAIVAAVVTGQGSYNEAINQAATYCEMVELWVESGGEYGWPAYRGTEVCDGQ